MKNNKQKKLSVSKILNCLMSMVLFLAILFCGQVVWQVSQNGYVSLADKSVFRVVTGSMEPTLPIGTILLSQETPIVQIEEGDIVCFRSLNDYLDGAIITHRVIAIATHEDGTIELYTQGDANTVSDGYTVTEENFIGKVVWNSKDDDILSTVIGGLTSQMGLILFIMVPCMILSTLVMGDAVKNIRKELAYLKQVESQQNSIALEIPEESYEEMERRIYQELKQELLQELQQKNQE